VILGIFSIQENHDPHVDHSQLQKPLEDGIGIGEIYNPALWHFWLFYFIVTQQVTMTLSQAQPR
jgi:hypothetical protein